MTDLVMGEGATLRAVPHVEREQLCVVESLLAVSLNLQSVHHISIVYLAMPTLLVMASGTSVHLAFDNHITRSAQ